MPAAQKYLLLGAVLRAGLYRRDRLHRRRNLARPNFIEAGPFRAPIRKLDIHPYRGTLAALPGLGGSGAYLPSADPPSATTQRKRCETTRVSERPTRAISYANESHARI